MGRQVTYFNFTVFGSKDPHCALTQIILYILDIEPIEDWSEFGHIVLEEGESVFYARKGQKQNFLTRGQNGYIT